jgi:hypothetical protein
MIDSKQCNVVNTLKVNSDGNPNTMKFLFMNMEGLTSKNNLLSLYAAENNLKVIAISEHWKNNEEIKVEQVDSFHLASAYGRKNHIKGGVAIYTHKSVEFKSIDIEWLCEELNFEVCAVSIAAHKVIVVSIYRSPLGDPDIFLASLEQLLYILSKFKGYNILIGGDYNAHFDVTADPPRPNVIKLKYLLKQFNCHCANSKPTRLSACLDNVITNLRTTDYGLEIVNLDMSDHSGILLSLDLSIEHCMKGLSNTSMLRNVSNRNLDQLLTELNTISWEELLVNPSFSAEETFNIFFGVLLENFDYFCPLKTLKKTKYKNVSKNVKSWYTPHLEELKKTVLAFRTVFEVRKDETSRQLYILNRNIYKKAVNQAKLDFNARKLEEADNKPKAAWNLVNKIRGKENRSAGEDVSPDAFNEYFTSSATAATTSAVDDFSDVEAVDLVVGADHEKFDWKLVSCEDVISAVNKMKSSKSSDVYGFSNYVIKYIIQSILLPLTFCFNLCLFEGVFPTVLKVAKVVPLYKNGCKSLPQSFRPISLVPTIGKILESVVKSQVCLYFDRFSLLSKSQFGYRTGRSTTDAVDVLVRRVIETFEAGGFARVTACDLSKAFDRVDHDILLNKLNLIGFKDVALRFFKSYLSDRRQIVEINGKRSSEAILNIGVPQGSVLGPILFIVMVNDLPCNILKSDTIMFADDTTFVTTAFSLQSVESISNHTLQSAVNWFRLNKFTMNETKTQNVTFTLNNVDSNNIEEKCIKLLGLKIDHNLTWTNHIDEVCTRLSRVIYLLKVLRFHVPPVYIVNVYHALFHSILSYGLILWGNSSKIGDVLLLQKKALRIITSSDVKAHCKPLFISLKIMTVINQYIYMLCVYIKDNEMVLNKDIHIYKTRAQNKIHVPRVRLSKTLKSHVVLGLKLFNHLPCSLTCLPSRLFKNSLYSFLVTNPFYSTKEFFETRL